MGPASILDMAAESVLDVRYGDAFGAEDLKLLEVDDAILQEILDHGVVIRGGLTEEAVLCTSTHTYAIKFVMTSNTVLVMPPPLMPDGCIHDKESSPSENQNNSRALASAMGAVTGHMELVEVAPNIEQLKVLLHQRPYKEEVEDADTMDSEQNRHGLYTWDDLLEQVQSSEKELLEGLKSLAAVQIGYFWRVVDRRYMQCMLELVLLNAVQHDWSLRALREDEVISAMNADGYPPQIVAHCLATFGHRVYASSEAPMDLEGPCSVNVNVWELNERDVCLHYASQLLSAASKWKLDDFLDAWQQNLPSGMQADLGVLKGEVLVEKLGSDSWLRPLSLSGLPSNPADRFAALFREKQKWEWQELEPYIRDLRAPGKSVEVLLLKYTRKTQSTADASPIFTAR